MLSTYELQHFTQTKDSLINILHNGFEASFCCEEYLNGNSYWCPMVCFCDIPPSLSNHHRTCYGDFVIGMDQKWGCLKDIHPVHYLRPPVTGEPHSIAAANNYLRNYYLQHNSPTFKNLIDELAPLCSGNSIIDGFLQSIQFAELLEKVFAIILPISSAMAFEKLFEGHQFCKLSKKIEYRKFYDEREWRYLPSFAKTTQYIRDNLFSLIDIIIANGYHGYQIADSALSPLYTEYNAKSNFLNGSNRRKIVNMRLNFNENDVAFLIVPSENDKESIRYHAQEYACVKMYTWSEAQKIG